MNWGRKKKTSASSVPGRVKSSIANMFPLSWISRLRQGDEHDNGRVMLSGRNVKDVKRNADVKSGKAEKLYAEAEENFWRLSFSDEGVHGRKRIGGSPSYDWLGETEISSSTCRSRGAKGAMKNESMDFNDMLLDMRKAKSEINKHFTREPTKSKLLRSMDDKLKNLELHQPSQGFNKDVKYASFNKGVDKKMVGEKGAQGNPNTQILAVKAEALNPRQSSLRISSISPSLLPSQRLHHEASMHSKLHGSECKNFAGKERKSTYINKDSLKRISKSGRSSSKVKVYSPRTPSKAELCKIRALEDLKKTRMILKEKTELESLAVVKRSFDPQRDFRNSMLEMILDKGMIRSEELEELLACYLLLNSDEYHDMIIKVFRQVWFDLNKDRLDPPLRDAEL